MHGFGRMSASSCPATARTSTRLQSESLPLAVIEAMAAGLPVLAGATGGIPELFDDGVEGRLWPLDDPSRGGTTLVGSARRRAARARAGARRALSGSGATSTPRWWRRGLLSFVPATATAQASRALPSALSAPFRDEGGGADDVGQRRHPVLQVRAFPGAGREQRARRSARRGRARAHHRRRLS